jgi:hypothetical protein
MSDPKEPTVLAFHPARQACDADPPPRPLKEAQGFKGRWCLLGQLEQILACAQRVMERQLVVDGRKK